MHNKGLLYLGSILRHDFLLTRKTPQLRLSASRLPGYPKGRLHDQQGFAFGSELMGVGGAFRVGRLAPVNTGLRGL